MYRADPFDALSPAHLTASATRSRPTLLGIASAHPPFEVTQEETWQLFERMSSVPFVKRLVESTKVKKRHIMWDPDRLLGGRWPAHRRPDGRPQ